LEPHRAGHGEPPVLRSNGRFVRDYVYVRDVVRAYLVLAEAVANGDFGGEAFNFSCGSPVTVLEIVRRIGDLLGSRLEPIVLDDARFEISEQTLSSAKARRLLDWDAKWSLAGGLAETIGWYRRHLGYGAAATLTDVLR
jgi:CDP-glucose 4,6-dehydratase